MDSFQLELIRRGIGTPQGTGQQPEAPASAPTVMPRVLPASYGPLRNEGSMARVVSFTPQEQAQNAASEAQPHNLASLDAEIARTRDPRVLAVLNEERGKLTAPKPPAAQAKPPTWDEVKKLPEMQRLSVADMEAARNQYFIDVVAPQVPTAQLDAAKAEFDRDTQAGMLENAGRRLSNTVRAVREGEVTAPMASAVRRGIAWIDESFKRPNPGVPEDKPFDRPFMERVQGYQKQGMTPDIADMLARKDIAEGVDRSQPLRRRGGPADGVLAREVTRGMGMLSGTLDGIRMSELASVLEAKRASKTPEQLAADRDYQDTVRSYQRIRADMERRAQELDRLPRSAAVRKMFEGEGAESWDNFVNAFKEDPGGAAAAIVGGSLPISLAVVATAALARLGLQNTKAAVAGGGLASTAAEFGNEYAENRKTMGHTEANNRALAKSGVIGLFDAASLGSAGKAIDDIAKSTGLGGAVKRYVKETGKQAVLGAGGETLGSVAAGREPQPAAVAAEALGEVLMGVPEGLPTAGGRAPAGGPGGGQEDSTGRVPRRTADPAAPISADDLLGKVEPAPQAATPAPAAATPDDGRKVEIARAYRGIMGIDKNEGDVLADPDPVKPAPAIEAAPRGQATTFTTERGAKLDGQFAVVEADDLTVSHDINLEKNAAFPQVLQPRDRSRAAYSVHIEGILNRLNPEQLGENPLASHGAPIIGEDGVVESGNGRVIVLQKAYNRQGKQPQAEQYRQWLADNAQRFGLDPAAMQGMRQPVLVRVRTTPVNRAEFARQANQESVARMSALELAKSDAARLGSIDDFNPGEGGEFSTSGNDRFIKRFVATLPATEQTELVDGKGRLSQSGLTRIRNAVLARAYGDSETLMRLVESIDDGSRNISKALLAAAPRIAKLREDIKDGALFALDITPDLMAAVDELTRIREDGKSVGQVLAQLEMFGGKGYSAETIELLAFLEENIRSPRRIAELIDNYLTALQGQGSPTQGDLIARENPTKSSVLAQARKGLTDERTEDQGGLPAGARAADEAADRGNAAAGVSSAQPVSEPRAPDAGDGKPAESAAGPAKRPARKKPVAAQGVKPAKKAEPPKPTPAAEATAKAFGSENKLFTKAKADAARAKLKAKLGQLNAGIDPEVIQAGLELAGYYIEGGARSFKSYSSKMLADLGESVRPYLKSWYLAVRNYPGFDNVGMDSEADIDAAQAARETEEKVNKKAESQQPAKVSTEQGKKNTGTAPEHRPAAGGEGPAIGGKPVADMASSSLALAVRIGGPEVKSVAEAELDRRGHSLGATDAEVAEVAEAFELKAEAQEDDGFQVTHVFDPPAKGEIVRTEQKSRVYHAKHGWMTVEQAKEKIAEWRAHAKAQGKTTANSDKVVLSLFDLTGAWSNPWVEAGYDVYRFDIQDDPEVGDVEKFSTEFFNDIFASFDGRDIYAILAACPCTDFAVSGAKHFAAKDADGRTIRSVELVRQTQATIEYFKPAVWALENPVGRIEKLTGLPPWRLSFDPNHFGDPYTKKTLIWGRFNADLPVVPVEPTEGSKMWAKFGGKSQATKNARSETPEGFAYAFFMANNAIDNPVMAIANQWDRLDRDLIKQAVEAGVTAEQIKSAVEDHYYMDLNDEAANQAIRDLIKNKPGGNKKPVAAKFGGITVEEREPARFVFKMENGSSAPVASLDDAQDKWNRFRIATGGGVSEAGNGGTVYENGKPVARISYNGRMWDPDTNKEIIAGEKSKAVAVDAPAKVPARKSKKKTKGPRFTKSSWDFETTLPRPRDGEELVAAGRQPMMDMKDPDSSDEEFVAFTFEEWGNELAAHLVGRRGDRDALARGKDFKGKPLTEKGIAALKSSIDGHTDTITGMLAEVADWFNADVALAFGKRLGADDSDLKAAVGQSETPQKMDKGFPVRDVLGLEVAIERPRGTKRTGRDSSGKAWEVTMLADYGYFPDTKDADGEPVDVYVGDDLSPSNPVFIIDQRRPSTGKLDEHKVIIGSRTREHAEALYDAHFSDGTGPVRRAHITELSLDELKAWLKSDDTVKPLVSVRAPTVEVMRQAVEKVGEDRFNHFVTMHLSTFEPGSLEPAEEAAEIEGVARNVVAGAYDGLTGDAGKKTGVLVGDPVTVDGKPGKVTKTDEKTGDIQVRMNDGETRSMKWTDALVTIRDGLPPDVVRAMERAAQIAKDLVARHAAFTAQERADRDQVIELVREKVYARSSRKGLAPDGDVIEVKQGREFYFLMGPPAAGKSSIANPLQARVNARIIDADVAKELMPEFDGGLGAMAVHEESSQIAMDLLRRAMKAGDNIIYPGVGKTLPGVRQLIAEAREAGYRVHVYRVDLPTEITIDRAIKRFRHTGRYVDVNYVASVGQQPLQVFDIIGNEGIADEYREYSTQVPYGHDPKILPRRFGVAGGVRGSDVPAVVLPGEGRERGVRSGAERSAERPSGDGDAGRKADGDQRSLEGLNDAGRSGQRQLPVSDPAERGEAGNRGGGDAQPVAARVADRGQMGLGFTEEGETDGGRGQPAGQAEGTAASGEQDDQRRQGERPAARRAGQRDSGDARHPAASLAPSNYSITDADELGAGGAKTKARANIAAIRLVKSLHAEARNATADEQAVLVKYVGWGGLKQMFDEGNEDFAAERAELKELLTADEYAAARRSVLDAHYTSKTVVEAIYSALRRMGFNGGRILEPAVGTGNFLGLMPADLMQQSSVVAVELDHITGQITKQLYQKANINSPLGFQDLVVPDGYFDAAVGNPPFGGQSIVDTNNPEISKFSIHNFFFAKSVQSLRPGGLLAMVVSNSFLDAQNKDARAWISERAELVGAIRLPNNAFLKNAGTEVTTDIVFLRKLAPGEKPSQNLNWKGVRGLEDPKGGEPIPLNNYFLANPDMMLGQMTREGTMYRADSAALIANPGEDLGEALARAVAKLPENIYQPFERTPEPIKAKVVVPSGVRVGGLFIDKETGGIAQRKPDILNKEVAELYEMPTARGMDRVKGMIKVRDALRTLMRGELDDYTDAWLKRARADLNREYEAFVKKNGFINSVGNRRAFQDDPDLPLLEALELDYDPGVSKEVAKKNGVEPRPPSAKKASIFTKRVLSPAQEVRSVASAADALSASLNARGRVDLDYMAQVYGRPAETIQAELAGVIYEDPQEGWVTGDAYLSGNVKAKLLQAQAAAERDSWFKVNVDALERVQPADIPANDIAVRLGSGWVPAKDVGDFIQSLLNVRPESLSYQRSVGRWIMSLQYRDTTEFSQTWGAKTKARESWGADKIIDAILNNTPITVKRKIESPDGHVTYIPLEAETDAANAKADAIKQKFREWIFDDRERRERLARLYNDTYNTDVLRKYDGSHLNLPGTNPNIQLTPHKKHSVWRIIQNRNTLLDHVVGSGKTFTTAAAIMEMRRLGLVRKPIIVVPNHIVRQWRDEWYTLYPNANILATTEDDFTKDNRKRLFSRIATGDWDAVIVAHSSFGKLPMPKAELETILNEQVREIAAAIAELKREKSDKGYSVRQMELLKARLEEKLKRAQERTGEKDDAVDFGELGVDAIAVDELHEFKNLYYMTQMRNVTGMGNPEGSGKAFDLFVKIRYLQKKNGVVIGATGTPVSNSLVEMYTMQRYMDYDGLKARGDHHLDSWAGTFADITNVWETHPSGNGYRLSTRFAKFVNLPELITQYRKFADVVTQQDMIEMAAAQGKRYPIPKLKGGKPTLHVAQRSPEQVRFFGVPEFQRDAEGNIRFKVDGARSDYVMPTAPDPESGKFYVTTAKDGYKIGQGYATTEEAIEAFELDYNTPLLTYNEGSILWKYENLRRLTKETDGKINALSVTNEARKAGLDFRMIDHGAPDFDGSKINEAVGEVKRIYDQWHADRGTQLIFMDLSTPKAAKSEKPKKAKPQDEGEESETIDMDSLLAGQSAFSAYDDMKAKLIASGIPAEQVAYIHDAKTADQKKKLFAKVNRGEIRVLLGSTPKMGAGTNVQKRLVAEHHMDAPWRPSDLEQREGRIKRQGNELYERDPEGFQIEIHRYATEKTYDTRMWQIIEHKASGIEQLRRGIMVGREMEDVSGEAANAADMKAAASGNPLIAEEIKLRDQLKKLENQAQAFRSGRYAMEDKAARLEQMPARAAKERADLKKLMALRQPEPEKGFVFKAADGTEVTELKALTGVVLEGFKAVIDGKKETVWLGSYRGFEVYVGYHKIGKLVYVDFAVPSLDITEEFANYGEGVDFSAQGFVQRMNNYLSRLDDRLVQIDAKEQQAAAELKKVQAELGKPFEKQDELESTRSRHRAVAAELQKQGGSVELTPAMRDELERARAQRAGGKNTQSSQGSNDQPDFAGLTLEEAENLSAAELRKAIQYFQENADTDARGSGSKSDDQIMLDALEELLYERENSAGENTALSRTTPRGGMDLEDLKSVAYLFRSKFKGLPAIYSMQSIQQAPPALRADIRALGGEKDTAAAWHNGEIYLFANNLRDPEHAAWAILHEATHHGLRGLFGRELDPVLMSIYMNNRRVRSEVSSMKRSNPKLSTVQAVEEVLADMGGDNLPQTVWDRLIAAVRRLVRRLGVSLELTDADVRDFVARALRYAKNPRKDTHIVRGSALSSESGDMTLDEVLEEYGETVPNRVIAERRFSAGDRIFLVHELDENVHEAKGITDLRSYAPDQMIVLPIEHSDLVPMDSALSRNMDREPGRAAVPTRTGILDTALRVPTQILGIDKLTSWAYDSLIEKAGALVPEKVKAGVVSDYGIPEAVIDRRALMQAHMRTALRQTQGFIDQLMTLTRAESRVAYEWMTGQDGDPEAIERLPKESQATLRQLRTLITSLGQEAVRLGQLSKDAYERSALSYLHRSYLKHETEQTEQQKAQRSRAIKVLGDQYKGRGMVYGTPMAKVRAAAPEWWGRKLKEGRADKGLKGQEFLRLERRANRGDGVAVLPGVEESGQRGKLLEVMYWPAQEPVPARFASWDRDAGLWEVRDVKGGELVMWRDFTPAERQRMGEIDEVRYAVAKTMHQMIHDIEAGRYLEWLANRNARPKGDGLNVVAASERMLDTFKPGEWVKVPEAEITGTSVKKYGKLAGLYIPGPIWNDVRQVMSSRYAPLGETYATLLRAWKISKTALSPAVHLNNIMANVIMADWHDVRATDLARALEVLIRDTEENRKILNEFEDNGGSEGMYVLSEIQRDQLLPLLDELRKDVDLAGGAGIVNAAAVLQALAHGNGLADKLRKAAAAVADSKVSGGVRKVANAMIDAYQAEDTVFRLAAYMKAKSEGASNAEAGKFARRSFLDYQINAPWIQAMRQTVFPFISFVYRAVPILAETAARKPWKLMKLALVLGGLNAVGYMLSGGDEDEERKLLPDEKKGKIFGFIAPKLIRMPWNDQHGSPVFLDIRRFIPVGDIFDVDQTNGAMPLLPSMIPGGPLAILAEVALNKVQFTGREITKGTDTGLEKAEKIFDHLFKAFAPNLPILPGSYSFTAIANAGSGKTDAFGREQSVSTAVASSFGVKLASYPADVAKRGIMLDFQGKDREIGENIGKLRRELQQKGITREEFDERLAAQLEKRRKLQRETRDRLQ